MKIDLKEIPLLILCGGRSERFGSPKGLALAPGTEPENLIQAHRRRYREAGGELVMVVLGHQATAYQDFFATLSPNLRPDICLNPKPERGPFSSLVEGIRAIFDLAERTGRTAPPAIFICPVDTLSPQPEVWRSLVRAFNSPGSTFAAVKPMYQKQGGHPVLLAAAFARSLLVQDPAIGRLDENLRALAADRLAVVEVNDPRIMTNINSPEGLQSLQTLQTLQTEA